MQDFLHGIWVPIVTPFTADGEAIDHAALARLARHLADRGVAGLVAGATTGEGCSLSAAEQHAVFDTLRRELGAHYPLLAGISLPDTRSASGAARAFAAAGADGLLVTTPPYLRPDQDGLRRHFETVAEAADLPLVIYNIPYRSGVCVELETLQALARDARIVGIKECGASVDRLMRLIHDTPLRVMIGEDSQCFAALCLGAHGAIAAAAHLRPELWVRLFERVRASELAAARQLAAGLQPLIRALFAEPNPAPVKALLARTGFGNATPRLPLTPASAACVHAAAQALAALAGF